MTPRVTFFLLLGFLLLPVAALAQTQGFQPLTSIPAIKDAATGADGIANFLNQLYVLSVGAAAVIAVVQIIRAGVMYSLGDSVTEKRDARHLLLMSVLGLVLVLSPTIVFGIINPNILSLKVNVGALGSGNQNQGGVSGSSGGTGATGAGGSTEGGGVTCAFTVAPDRYLLAYAWGLRKPFDSISLPEFTLLSECKEKSAALGNSEIDTWKFYDCQKITDSSIQLEMPKEVTVCPSKITR